MAGANLFVTGNLVGALVFWQRSLCPSEMDRGLTLSRFSILVVRNGDEQSASASVPATMLSGLFRHAAGRCSVIPLARISSLVVGQTNRNFFKLFRQ